MYTICYVSSVKPGLSQEELEDLFTSTEKYNTESDITGILLYESGKFLQVLEGKKEELTELYDKIAEDSRHGNIFVILKSESKKRIFEDYSSRFSIVKTKEDLQKIETYLNEIEDAIPNLKYVKGILEPFLL